MQGRGHPRGEEGCSAPGRNDLQQGSPSSSTAILPLLAASMSPKICSQPLSSTAGQRGPPLEAHGHRQKPQQLWERVLHPSLEIWLQPPPQLQCCRTGIHPAPWHVSKHSHNKTFFPLFLAPHPARFKDIPNPTLHPSHSVNQHPKGYEFVQSLTRLRSYNSASPSEEPHSGTGDCAKKELISCL